jgi:uncharacterized protein (DUF305 family)
MENKTTLISATATMAVFIGLLGGYFIWGHQVQQDPMMSNNSVHIMPDGTTMSNSGSDMTSMMANMNAGLQGKTGDTFDQEFLSEMIVHHQGAIDMAKLALTNAKHPEIKNLANGIITAQTNEIAEMKAWQKTWYNQ